MPSLRGAKRRGNLIIFPVVTGLDFYYGASGSCRMTWHFLTSSVARSNFAWAWQMLNVRFLPKTSFQCAVRNPFLTGRQVLDPAFAGKGFLPAHSESLRFATVGYSMFQREGFASPEIDHKPIAILNDWIGLQLSPFLSQAFSCGDIIPPAVP
jgi:hypothetical protein